MSRPQPAGRRALVPAPPAAAPRRAPAAESVVPRSPALLARGPAAGVHRRRGARVGRRARAAATRSPSAAARCSPRSAVAKGLFAGDPWSLDISGGFASPLAAELIGGADVVVGWGCALNMWTTRHGALIARTRRSSRSTSTPDALGAHRRSTSACSATLRRPRRRARLAALARPRPGYRTADVRARHRGRAAAGATCPTRTRSDGPTIDPRTLSIALDDLLPAERTVAIDSGNFMGYPAMFLSRARRAGFCFTQAFQSIGLGLATAIGAALARPDRLTGGRARRRRRLMGLAELETVGPRSGCRMLIVVYNDAAYGAEVHHFGPDGHPLDMVRFPRHRPRRDRPRASAATASTVRRPADLAPCATGWPAARRAPLLVDAKVAAGRRLVVARGGVPRPLRLSASRQARPRPVSARTAPGPARANQHYHPGDQRPGCLVLCPRHL